MRLYHLTDNGSEGPAAVRAVPVEGADAMAALQAWLADRTGRIWVDVGEDDSLEDFEQVVVGFGLDRGAVREATMDRYPPKVEFYQDHAFLLFRGMDAVSESIEFGTIQIGVFLGPDFLVTRHTETSPSINAIWDEVGKRPQLGDRLPVLVARLGLRVCGRYLPVLLKLETRLEGMEEEMFTKPSDRLIEELLVYKRQLKKLRRIASYHVAIFERLAKEDDPWFEISMQHDLLDGLERFERVVSLANLYNDLANDLMNAYLSISSHRLNNIMKVLTIVTAIFVPLSFLAGIYGMNFAYMPELAWPPAYFILLSVMATVVVVLLGLFRKRGWI